MAEEVKSGVLWYGKPIEDYTQPELVQIVIRCLEAQRETRETMDKIINLRRK